MGKDRKKAIGALVFGVGLIALLIGAMTQIYTTVTGVIIALAVWIIGGALVKFAMSEKEETP